MSGNIYWRGAAGSFHLYQCDYVHILTLSPLPLKCGTVMPSDINHLGDPATKEKIKAMMEGAAGGEGGGPVMTKKKKDLFSDKI